MIHDESKFLKKQREFWESVLNPANPAAVVGQDRRKIEFPLPVKELRLEDSRSFPQLQIADLIASAARAHGSGLVARTNDPFLNVLRDAGLLNALAGGVWPTKMISPEELETDGTVFGDAAEFIGGLVKPRNWPRNILGSRQPRRSAAAAIKVQGFPRRWSLPRSSGTTVSLHRTQTAFPTVRHPCALFCVPVSAGGEMNEQRKYAILFAATILAARKLHEIGTKPCPGREAAIAQAVIDAEQILGRIERRYEDRRAG